MASLPVDDPWPALSRCLACGGTIEALLGRLGSLRCAVCRLQQAPLDPGLVDWWRERPEEPARATQFDTR
jgi:hypothetical protein